VVVWGIASMEPEEDVRNYVAGLGVTFPILLDTDGSVHATYDQEFPFPTGAYPQDWVIGTDGIIVYANNTFEVDEMTAVIEAELAP